LSRRQADTIRGLPRPLLLGHRGLNTVAPENTLAAIDGAAAAGAHGVEIDVRPCATGQLVVSHDPTLRRITGGADERPVAAVSLDELRQVTRRAARGGPAEGMATLDEVVNRCRELGLVLNVEMKRDVPSRAALVWACARTLAPAGRRHPIVVSSFDPVMLAGLRLAAPQLPVGLLLHRDGRRYQAQLWTRPLGAVAVHVERTMVQASQVARWRARGLRVIAWTVNDLQEVRDLYAIGVDGFISDDPARLRPELERLGPPY